MNATISQSAATITVVATDKARAQAERALELLQERVSRRCDPFMSETWLSGTNRVFREVGLVVSVHQGTIASLNGLALERVYLSVTSTQEDLTRHYVEMYFTALGETADKAWTALAARIELLKGV